MADILVRGLPDELHERYKRLAQKHHRSLPAETIHLIEQAVTEEEQLEQRDLRAQRLQALDTLVKIRESQPPSSEEDTLAIIREGRRR